MDLEQPDRTALGGDYDLVVLGEVLEHLRDPAACLRLAHEISAPQARLVCCIPNGVHASVIERMLGGDLSYDSAIWSRRRTSSGFRSRRRSVTCSAIS